MEKDKDASPGKTLRRLGTLFGKGSSSKEKEKQESKVAATEENPTSATNLPKPERFFIWEPDLSESFTVWQGTHGEFASMVVVRYDRS